LALLSVIIVKLGAMRWVAPFVILIGIASCRPAPQRFDLLVYGGEVYDGVAQDPQRVDIGISGDRIIAIGDLSSATAALDVDARGAVVAPGFIDVQSRSGVTLLADGQGESHLRQGVTTVIIGDVESPAFGSPSAETALLKPFAVAVDWSGLDSYYNKLLQRGTTMNVGTLVPLSSTKGEDSAIDEAMRAGALGVSVVLGPSAAKATTDGELLAGGRSAAVHDAVMAMHYEGPPESYVSALDATLRATSAAKVATVIYQPPLSETAALGAVIRRMLDIRAKGFSVSTTLTPDPDAHAARAYWLRDSGATVGSQAAAVRADGLLAGKIAQSRAYDAFASVLARYVREEKVISLGEAIRRMTNAAAAQFRIEDRGVIRVGALADVVVFDARTVGPPSGAEQQGPYAQGMRHVIVNGVAVIHQNATTGARPGRAVFSRSHTVARPRP
jgi:dihydroorotase-like cyclic amidohydrolase